MSGVTNLELSTVDAAKTAKTVKTPQTVPEILPFGSSGSLDIGQIAKDDLDEIGPFPVDSLPPILREIVKETSRVTQTPYALGAVVTLGILSASFGGGLLVQSGAGRTTPPNLFLLGIARSGTGKGRVFSTVAKPFMDAGREVASNWNEHEKPRIDAELKIATRRAEAKEKEAARENDENARRMLTGELQRLEEERQRLESEKEAPPCYYVGDTTREKLAVVLSGQSGEALASLSPEARGIVGVVMGRYSSGSASDEDIYLSGYSGDSLRVDRLSRAPVLLHAPRLALTWLIQPDVARKLAEDERMTEGGLLPRFLLCDVKAEAQDEPEESLEIKSSVTQDWEKLIRALLATYREHVGDSHTIEATTEAHQILRDFTNESRRRTRSGGDLLDVEAYVARWGENAWRLALCLHGSIYGKETHLRPLGEDSAKKAVEIVRWFVRAQLDFLAVNRFDRAKRHLTRLREILRDAGGEQTLRVLRRSHRVEEDELHTLVRKFPTMLRIETRKTGGRDSKVACIP